jgi:hypothetical protein
VPAAGSGRPVQVPDGALRAARAAALLGAGPGAELAGLVVVSAVPEVSYVFDATVDPDGPAGPSTPGTSRLRVVFLDGRWQLE